MCWLVLGITVHALVSAVELAMAVTVLVLVVTVIVLVVTVLVMQRKSILTVAHGLIPLASGYHIDFVYGYFVYKT